MTCCSSARKRDTCCVLRENPKPFATFHVSRITFHASRFTFYANPAAFFNAATLSSFSHGASMSVRPKWP